MPHPILEEQLQKRKNNDEKLREVRRFYANAGREKEFLSPRTKFDKSIFREVLVDKGGFCNGFIECVLVANNRECLLNIGLRPKYKNYDVVALLVDKIIELPEFKSINDYFITIHIADSILENVLAHIGFRRVVEKSILSRIHARLDGFHLTYLFERRNTVANRQTMSPRVMPVPRMTPIRTGDETTEGKFDALKRLKELKENR